MSNLGNKIKLLREAKMMSISKLSKESTVGKSTISEIETGKASNPKIETLSKLAIVLGVTVNELLTTEEKLDIAYDVISQAQKITGDALNHSSINLENSIYSISTKYTNETFSKDEQKEITDFIDFIISRRK